MKKNRSVIVMLLLCFCCLSMDAQPNNDSANTYGATEKGRYKNYELLNAGEPIQLYSRTMLAQRKGVQTMTLYYFRKGGSSPMLPLTVANIKAAFAPDTAFVTSIEKYFHSDDMLLQYDKQAGMYRLNSIYKQVQHH